MKTRSFITEFKEILILSIPIIISQIGYVLMGFSDNVIVGRLGAAELAATGVSNSVFFLTVVTGIGGLSVIAPIISKFFEEGDHVQGKKILISGVFASLIYSLILSLVLSALIYYFEIFNQPLEVTRLSKEYLGILIFSIPPMLIFIALKQYTDGLSDTKTGMYISLAGLVINIILCYLFCFGYGPIPKMGVKGAALATTLARIVMVWLIYIKINKMSGSVSFTAGLVNHFNVFKAETLYLFKKGFPNGLQMLAESSAFSLAAVMVGWISVTQLAAHQIALSWAALSYMVSTGISIAVSIRVGAGFGARNKSRILYSCYTGLFLVVLYETCTFAGFVLGNEFCSQVFTSDPAVIKVSATLMVLMGLFQIPDGVQAVLLGSLRGLLDVKVPTYLVIFSYVAVCLPLAYILAFNLKLESWGIWLGLVIGLVLSSVLLTFRFLYFTKRLNFN